MAYMMVEIFVMGGVIIPLMLSAILYKERIGAVQITGIILLLMAVYCMCTYKRAKKVKLSVKDFLLLLLCAISSGISDFSQKLYIKEIENANISIFNLYTYFFAAIILFIACLVFRVKEKSKADGKPSRFIIKPIFHYVTVMAICLFLNSYFKTLAAKHLDAILLYPLNQGCSVVMSLVMSVAVFKEKINAKGIVGVALSIISMILINVFGSY